jgi:hypothetical protein
MCVAQLHDLGLDKHGIRRRLASGFLHPVHRGVFSVGVTIVSLRGRYLAAVLACGTGAALSHRSAADLWGLRPNATRLEVTVPAKRPGPPWVEVHRTRVLAPQDFTTRDGIPVTSVARTLLDLGAVVRPPDLEVAVDRAERLGIFDLTAGPCGGWSPPIGRAARRAGSSGSAGRCSIPRRTFRCPPSMPWSRERPELTKSTSTGRSRSSRSSSTASSSTARAGTRSGTPRASAVGIRVMRLTWDDVTVHGERTLRRVRLAGGWEAHAGA